MTVLNNVKIRMLKRDVVKQPNFRYAWRRTRRTAMWTGLHFCFQAIMTIAKGKHQYRVTVNWTGNSGTGTSSYKAYSRNYVIQAADKPDMLGSSDPAFRGDSARWNPEDMLVASLSACHKLWYLHFCAVEGVRVEAYRDEAEGVMVEDPERGGAFTLVTLRPEVTIRAGDDVALAAKLHERAHHFCFIANSVNFPIRCEPRIVCAP